MNDSTNDCKSEAKPLALSGLTRRERGAQALQSCTRQRGRVTAYALIPCLLLVLTLAAGAAAVWQWQRIGYHAHKAQVAIAQALQPQNLNQSVGMGIAAGFVTVTGYWLPSSTVTISPRMMDGKMGAHSVSVLRYQDASGAVQHLAVQRGWAQQTQPNLAPVLADLPASAVTLTGELVASLPKAFELKAAAPQALGLWQNYQPLAHARLVNQPLAPHILVLLPTSPDVERTVLRRNSAEQVLAGLEQKANSNRGYALQWLLLCLVGLCGLAWMWRTQRKVNQKT